jgi:hypothetical protein
MPFTKRRKPEITFNVGVTEGLARIVSTSTAALSYSNPPVTAGAPRVIAFYYLLSFVVVERIEVLEVCV